jgi:light-regulated signal transduction histidine kinase (bacteriophytochrome)
LFHSRPFWPTDRKMFQVLQNLIGNAIKSMVQNRLRSNLRPLPVIREWIFAISNNGIGFSMEFKDKIFKVFQKLHSKDDFEGTEVGLTIVKKVFEGHGGENLGRVRGRQRGHVLFHYPKTANR